MQKKTGHPALLSMAMMLLILSPFVSDAGGREGERMSLATASITVGITVLGQTTKYIGATEAGIFYIADLTDLGINVYRMWTKMNELEWWDDDDARATPAYQCTEIGTPTVAEIKADQASGFANTIPWDWWDEQFTGTYYKWSGNSRQQVIQACVNNGITPVLVLRNRDDQNQPNYCSGAWAPDSPITQADLNEWWEHAFAIAYWLNVRHSYGVTHFEVLNEPDLYSQGWHGTQAEYVQLVETAYDAVKFANDIAGIGTVIHAPVVSNYNSTYIAYSLDNADSEIAVVDYHNYDNDPSTSIATVKSTIAAHNPDGVTEPVWLSEWGTYTSTYDDFNRAILTAQQLMTFSERGVQGVTIFGMYDWGSFYGLLDTSRNRSETYYAYRLMARGLKGAKDRLQFTSSGVDGDIMVTRGGGKVYIIVINGGATIQADVSALGVDDGDVDIWEYSSANKDAIVATPTLSGGRFTFTAPASGIVLAKITPSPTVITLVNFTAMPLAGAVLLEWETASEMDVAGFNLWRSGLAAGEYVQLNAELIPARGSPTQGARYTYTDADIVPGILYWYRLEEVDLYGVSTFHGPAASTSWPRYPTYLPLLARSCLGRVLGSSPAHIRAGPPVKHLGPL